MFWNASNCHDRSVNPTALTTSDAINLDFWRGLCPNLSINGLPSPESDFAFGNVSELLDDLRHEGYVSVSDVVPTEQVEVLRACIESLYERRIPVVFAFVYDELWSAFQGITIFLKASLGAGYRALPALWVWRLEASETASGWTPHRDRAAPTFDGDETPHSLTVWLALSDATPLNGCVYLVPSHLDDGFRQRVESGEGVRARDLQCIRALPATPGSMLAWNQAVIHWGGRASRRAGEPRVSASLEFQRGDKPPLDEPLLDASPELPFRERLALIGAMLLRYSSRFPLTEDMRGIAEALRGDSHLRV